MKEVIAEVAKVEILLVATLEAILTIVKTKKIEKDLETEMTSSEPFL